MRHEIELIKKREAEMSRQYGIYATGWEEDWPLYYALKRDLAFYREKFKNKFEIFETFKFVLALFLATVIFIIAAIITKNLAIFLAGFFGSIIAVSLWFYLYYFVFIKKQINNIQKIIGPFYIKYNRRVLKSYIKKYKPDECPPRPISALYSEDYFNIDTSDEAEDVDAQPVSKKAEKKVEEAKQENEREPIVVEEEKTDGKEEKAVSGIDLRLVGNSDRPDSIVSESDISDSTVRAEEEVLSGSREPEPTVWEESPEGNTESTNDGLTEPADTITLCDETEAVEATNVEPEGEEELDYIFEDYREDQENDLENELLATSQWLDFYENLDDTEDEPKEEDPPAKEKGSERIFEEGYKPTTDELLAAIRALRRS